MARLVAVYQLSLSRLSCLSCPVSVVSYDDGDVSGSLIGVVPVLFQPSVAD